MPFSETIVERNGVTITITNTEWEHIFEKWIKRSVEEYGGRPIVCERSPELPGNFVKGIIKDINDADLVIADLTGSRPNVFYELGIRHALKNGTIIITQEYDEIPSDLKSYYCFPYEYTNEYHKYHKFYDKFSKKIHSLIDKIEKENYSSDNPVSDFLEIKKSPLNNLYQVKNIYPSANNSNILFVSTNDGFITINLDDIIYLEGYQVTTIIHLKESRIHTSTTLENLLELIRNNSLVRIHSIYAVNIEKIISFDNTKMFLNHKNKKVMIPIEKNYLTNLFGK